MFARRVFGGPYDAFRITLEYGSPSYQAPSTHAVRLPKAVATLNLAFSSDDSVETVVNWFTEKQSALILDQHLEERIRLELNYDEHRVSTELKLEAAYPTLRCLTFARAVGSNTVSTEVMSTLLKLCDLTGTCWPCDWVVGAFSHLGAEDLSFKARVTLVSGVLVLIYSWGEP